MSRIPANSLASLRSAASRTAVDQTPVLRRFFAVEAATMEGERAQAAAVRSAVAEPGEASKEIFWMRDPKTGNWIPENRFGEVDVAELRTRLLAKK